MRHLKYLKYVLKHKWFVMKECFKHGIYFRGIFHDISKFSSIEWFPYVSYFYGNDEKNFNYAWLHHQNNNDHHWQWWLLNEDYGNIIAMEMSYDAMFEMICDWYGARMAQKNDGWFGVAKWYKENKKNIKLHEKTRKRVENTIFSYSKYGRY